MPKGVAAATKVTMDARRGDRGAPNKCLVPMVALFSSEKWKVFGTVALSFVYDKYYPIMD